MAPRQSAVLRVLLPLLALAWLGMAHAWENSPDRRARIDALLDRLSETRSQPVAARLQQAVWHQWLNADDTEINAMMRDAFVARDAGDLDSAVRILSDIIEKAPDYAEGWNQRATTYYEMGDDARSLLDIAETLRREPRHFGALSGRALIAIRAGDAQAAIENIEAARRIHPFVGLAAMLPALREVRDRTTGQPV